MIETVSLFGNTVSLYYLFWLVGLIVVLVMGYFTGKGYGFGFSKSILYVTGTVALGYLLLWGTSWLFGGGKVNGLNFVRIVTFLPIPIFLLSHLYRDRFGTVADFIAPLLAIFHGVTHIGCIFPGCCHGYPAQWGLFSNIAETVCFPIQPIEAFSSVCIGMILMLMAKRQMAQGKLYAWYLFLFGGTRFIWEFFRNNEKIWNGISELAFHALVAMLLGLVVLVGAKWMFKGSRNDEKV